MKKLISICCILIVVASCSEEQAPIIPTDETFINRGSDGKLTESADIDLIVDDRAVGKIIVNLKRDSVLVDYKLTDQMLAVSSLKFDIATEKQSLPTVEGKLAPEDFRFREHDLQLSMKEITGSSEYTGALFFSFYVELAQFSSPIEEQSVEATIKNTHTLSDKSYFRALIATGSSETEYSAYCLQGDQAMDTSVPHDVYRLISSSPDTEKLESVIDRPSHLDVVNWILNQPVDKWIRKDGKPANGADRQMAIWKIIETTGNPTGVNIKGIFESEMVSTIVADALKYGQNYKPKCGEKIIVILHKGALGGKAADGTYNTGNYANPKYQVTGIVYSIDCYGDVQTCWASGSPFTPSAGGSYFAMFKD